MDIIPPQLFLYIGKPTEEAGKAASGADRGTRSATAIFFNLFSSTPNYGIIIKI